MGDGPGARDAMQAALDLRLSLVAADPGMLAFLSDAARSQTTLAEFDLAQGDPASAEPLIADAVAKHVKLAGAAPDDPVVLRELSIAQNIHASTLMQLNRNSEAVETAKASLETADRLLQIAPNDTEHLHDRLVTLNRLGDAQFALGDSKAAVESFKAMVEVGNKLLDIDAYSTPWANDVGIALERLGDAQSAAGDVAAALKSQQDALALRDWLNQQDPSNPDWYRNLALSHAGVAEALSAREDYEGALPHQDEALRIMRDLSAAYPDDVWYKLDVVRALDQRAMLLRDPTAENQEALGMLEALQAAGRLPEGYEDWITGFRKNLGLPVQ